MSGGGALVHFFPRAPGFQDLGGGIFGEVEDEAIFRGAVKLPSAGFVLDYHYLGGDWGI